MKFDEFMQATLDLFPNATISDDEDGQVIIHTDLVQVLGTTGTTYVFPRSIAERLRAEQEAKAT